MTRTQDELAAVQKAEREDKVRVANPDNRTLCHLSGAGVKHGPHRHEYLWMDTIWGYDCVGLT